MRSNQSCEYLDDRHQRFADICGIDGLQQCAALVDDGEVSEFARPVGRRVQEAILVTEHFGRLNDDLLPKIISGV